MCATAVPAFCLPCFVCADTGSPEACGYNKVVHFVSHSRELTDAQVVFFEGSYSEYAADLKTRNGGNADPSRVKYRKMA